MTDRRPSLLAVLQLGTFLQAAVLVPVALAWLWVPVRELRSYRSSTAHDPTADLGPWVVPIPAVGAVVVALTAHPANRRLRLVSPDVATRVPDPHRATGHPPTRRH